MNERVEKIKHILAMMYLKHGNTTEVVKLSEFLDTLIVREQLKRREVL